MATNMFYSLNERKIKNFYNNFQELLLEKSTNDITIEDILEFTGISRATFYNYFIDINELYSDYIEYKLQEMTKNVESIMLNKSNSMFEPIPDLFNSLLKFLDDEKIFKMASNFLHSNNRIIRTAYSENMERFILGVTQYYMTETIEGKKINDMKKVYTLLNIFACAELVGLESEVYKKLGKNYAVCMFDFEFLIKVLQEGVNKLYP